MSSMKLRLYVLSLTLLCCNTAYAELVSNNIQTLKAWHYKDGYARVELTFSQKK